jgi:hypothetical protein
MAACSSSSSGSSGAGCNVSYDCSAEQTCWTQDGHTFACQPAGSQPAGSSCNPDTTALTCGPQTACLGNNGVGTCTYWCDANGMCPGDAGPCTVATDSNGVQLRFCQ